MVHTYEKSASLHNASFLTLTEVKCCRCPASCSEMLFAESKNVFAASKRFFSCVFSLFSSVPLAFSAIPSPPRSPFSVYPSFLIHFLCITPLLSTPIYSALPPPIFHKHTLYFPLLPSVTLPPSLLPSLALFQCVITLSSTSLLHPLFIISLSFPQSRHLMLISRVSFPPLSLLPI